MATEKQKEAARRNIGKARSQAVTGGPGPADGGHLA
jgi:hypothetical protein